MPTNTKNYDIDYNIVKSAIRKSTETDTLGVHFHINYEKLSSELANHGLTVVKTNPDSSPITLNDVTGLAEFYKGTKLKWITSTKESANIIFIKTSEIDEMAQNILNKLETPQVDIPTFDKIEALAYLLATYSCYTAVCVSYRSNSLKKTYVGLEIVCRANTVTIKKDNYQYRGEDIVDYGNTSDTTESNNN